MTQEDMDDMLAVLRRPPSTEREQVRAALFAALGAQGNSEGPLTKRRSG